MTSIGVDFYDEAVRIQVQALVSIGTGILQLNKQLVEAVKEREKFKKTVEILQGELATANQLLASKSLVPRESLENTSQASSRKKRATNIPVPRTSSTPIVTTSTLGVSAPTVIAAPIVGHGTRFYDLQPINQGMVPPSTLPCVTTSTHGPTQASPMDSTEGFAYALANKPPVLGYAQNSQPSIPALPQAIPGGVPIENYSALLPIPGVANLPVQLLPTQTAIPTHKMAVHGHPVVPSASSAVNLRKSKDVTSTVQSSASTVQHNLRSSSTSNSNRDHSKGINYGSRSSIVEFIPDEEDNIPVQPRDYSSKSKTGSGMTHHQGDKASKKRLPSTLQHTTEEAIADFISKRNLERRTLDPSGKGSFRESRGFTGDYTRLHSVPGSAKHQEVVKVTPGSKRRGTAASRQEDAILTPIAGVASTAKRATLKVCDTSLSDKSADPFSRTESVAMMSHSRPIRTSPIVSRADVKAVNEESLAMKQVRDKSLKIGGTILSMKEPYKIAKQLVDDKTDKGECINKDTLVIPSVTEGLNKDSNRPVRNKTERVATAKKKSRKPCYKCWSCDKVFKDSKKLNAHAKIHFRIWSYYCKYCNKGFSFKTNQEEHMKTCLQRPSTASNNSSKGSDNDASNNRQQNSICCKICKQKFNSIPELIKHMEYHKKKNDFKCDSCPQRFASKSQLRRHRLTHLGQRSFHCELCSLTFNLKSAYRIHMSEHK